jgi:hypothetical protein
LGLRRVWSRFAIGGAFLDLVDRDRVHGRPSGFEWTL